MKDIAERAGISRTGLLHHFGGKAELLVEVLAAHERETAAIVREADDLDVLRTQLRVTQANEARPGLIQLHSIISSEATADGHRAHELYQARKRSFLPCGSTSSAAAPAICRRRIARGAPIGPWLANH